MEGFISIEISRSADNHASAEAVRLTTKDDKTPESYLFVSNLLPLQLNSEKNQVFSCYIKNGALHSCLFRNLVVALIVAPKFLQDS
jgi:hypothetical protein